MTHSSIPLTENVVIATVVVEFDAVDLDQLEDLAHAIWLDERVLTIRMERPGERSVYRIDVPHHLDPDTRHDLAMSPARLASSACGVPMRTVRFLLSDSGLGDPEGGLPSSPLPWETS
jgi:hypothetical protein